jgi:hypothetical protein
MRVIGEDRSERLDKIPATLRVIVTRRPKYGCECEEAIVQARRRRRLFFARTADAEASASPIASEALVRIHRLNEIEEEIRGLPPEKRIAVRQERAKPEVEALKSWFEDRIKCVPRSSAVRDAINYGSNQWDGLIRYLDDGRIEIDSNTVERSMRPIALSRKNSLFAGHDQGAKNWAIIASLIETCKLNGVNPYAWLSDVLTKLVNRWPARRIGELMPWAYVKAETQAQAA